MSTHRSPLVERLYRLADVAARRLAGIAALTPTDDTVAVLIDGENIGPELLLHILAESCRYGAPRIRYLYGHTARASILAWQPPALHYGIELRHQANLTGTGKNAADLALTVDALSIHYERGVTRFCLASDDADYTPLITRLRQRDCMVMVLGRPGAARALQMAATSFVALAPTTQPATDMPPPAKLPVSQPAANMPLPAKLPVSQVPKPASQVPQANAAPVKRAPASAKRNASPAPQSEIDPLHELIVKVLLHANVTTTTWVRLTQLGQWLKQVEPAFTVNQYGHKQLNALVRARSDLFVIHDEQNTGASMLVRLRVSGTTT